MKTRSTDLADLARLAELHAARVLEVEGTEVRVDVGDGRTRLARLAGVTAAEGSEVVVAGSEGSGWFVLANLGVTTPATDPIRLRDGSSATAAADGASLAFADADGRPLFRYETDGERGRVVLESADLELRSERSMRIRSGGDVSIEGRRVVSRAVDGSGNRESAIRLDPETAQIAARETVIASRTVQATAERFDVDGRSAHVRMGRLVLAARRLETLAGTVVESARNVYRKVRELSQTRAGRIRTIADGDAQLRARRVVHHGRESYKVKSDKIHLA